jgi:hypothetical protein
VFIDPDPKQVDQAKALGADAIEFQTASYSEAVGAAAAAAELDKLRAAAAHAAGLGLHVHLGHGLNYVNVKPVVRIPGVRGAEHRPRDRVPGRVRRAGAGRAGDEGGHDRARPEPAARRPAGVSRPVAPVGVRHTYESNTRTPAQVGLFSSMNWLCVASSW